MTPSVTAIIPARGGSKGIPHKNIRTLCGRPLIAYSILAARDCSIVTRCVVTTDDSEIKRISLACGAEVVDRPPELATDTSLSQDAVRHVLEILQRERTRPDFFVLLQPTSPLRTARHLQRCFESFFQADYGCAISVTENEHHPYKSFVVQDNTMMPLWDVDSLSKPRQLLPKTYRQNGAIYIVRTSDFLERNSFYITPVMPFVMISEESIDIDTEADFILAEHYLKLSGT